MFWRRKKEAAVPPAQLPPVPAAGPASADTSSGTQFLTGDSDLDRRTIEVLLETIARVSTLRDIQELLVDIVDHSVELTASERGFLILVGAEGQPEVRVARSRERCDVTEDVRFSTSVVNKVLASGEPMLSTVQSDSDALELGRSVFDLKLRAVMCVPLAVGVSNASGPAPGLPPGALYVDSRAATREFNHRDLGLFYALARNISIALENARLHLDSLEKQRIEKNLELAQAIQDGLMPPIPKDVPGLEVHGWFRPAEQTSGDFYDFVRTADGRLAVVIGDVSGHGIGPALITAAAQGGLRSYLRVLPDPAAALSMHNQDLSERIDDGMFLTLLLLVFGDDGSMQVLNAGHHPALLVRRGEVLTTRSHGAALGMLPEVPYQVSETVALESGDLLLAFTDGLIEAHDPTDKGRLFGEEQVRELLIQHAAQGTSAEEIARSLAEAALAFSGGRHEDDITLVVVRKH
jgi:serine phosphatase RsbU (regulator of sigma subunit)